ncbi:MAG: hypothetical protein ACE5E9_03195 [Nitrospinaceae bacterium]
MIKEVTQYLVICDNPFCDTTLRASVDHHSYERRQQFIQKIKYRGWECKSESNRPTAYLCPSCKHDNEKHPSRENLFKIDFTTLHDSGPVPRDPSTPPEGGNPPAI